jgi:hypothetical protein
MVLMKRKTKEKKPMSKKQKERIKELEVVNGLWKHSYKKLETSYDDLMSLNKQLAVELEQAKHDRKLWFEKALKKTEMLDVVYDTVKDYRVNEHLYGVENGILQGWFNR